jgi:hypothetical protein
MPNVRVSTSGMSARGGSDIPRCIGGNDQYTVLMLHANGVGTTIADSSVSDKIVIPYGNATQVKTNKKFGKKSIRFDGDGDYLEIPVPVTDFEFGATEEFAIDFWVTFDEDSTTRDQYILSKGDFERDGYALYYTISDGRVHLKVDGSSVLNFVWTFNANQWYHFALVGDGSNIKAYVDGVEKASISQIALQ